MFTRCDLRIELDSPERFPRAGEELRGKVHVRTRRRVQCRALTVGLICSVTGKRGTESVTVEETTLVSGARWQPGDVQSYPFRLSLPKDRWSHQGELLSLQWAVEARATVPRAPASKAEFPLRLMPPTRPRTVVAPASNDGPERRWASSCLPASLAMVGGCVALLVASRALPGTTGLVGAAVGLLLLGLLGVGVSLPRYLASRKLGDVRVAVTQARGAGYREAGCRDELQCTVAMRPGADVREVTATLTVAERARRPAGTDGPALRASLAEERVALSADPSRSTEDTLVYAGRLPLPEPGTVPFPWTATPDAIVWEVAVHVDVSGWPDVDETLALDVRGGP